MTAGVPEEPSLHPSELSSHASRDDAWVAVQGVVYDITAFVARHPGGNVFGTMLGTDVTSRFMTSHLVDVSKRLRNAGWRSKMGITRVGTLRASGLIEGTGRYDRTVLYEWDGDPFRATLYKRVREHLAAEDLPQITRSGPAISIVLIFGAIAALWTAGMVYGIWWANLFLGYAVAMVGMRIGHPAIHGAFSTNRVVRLLSGYTFDLLGASRDVWDIEHTNHHYNTNTEHDTDLMHQPLLRLHPNQPRQPHHRYQHLYVLALYGMVAFRWFFTSTRDVMKLRLTPTQKAVHLGIQVLPIMFTMVAPFVFLPVSTALLCLAAYWLSLSYALTMNFAITHTNLECDYALQVEPPLPWAEMQVRGSCNWRAGSFFWNFMTGGMNHQVEHHLFPVLDQDHYPRIAPIVEQTCQEFGIPYRNKRSYREILVSHLALLRRLGSEDELGQQWSHVPHEPGVEAQSA